MINVILADHQRVFRIGMASALAAEDDIRVVGQPHTVNQLLNGLQSFRPHVLVLSSAYLGKVAEIKQIASRQQTAILLLEETGSVGLSQLSPNVDGVIQRSDDDSTVVRCIRQLARDGSVSRFAPKQGNQKVEFRQDSVGLRVRQRLSRRELRIIALVVQGYKNREIASHTGSTEQGIKNSLRKIFDTTGVYDRLELALFVLYHGIVVREQADGHPTSAQNALAVSQSFRDKGYRRTVN